MRLLLYVSLIVGLAQGQGRSFYASRPGTYSKVLPRFRTTEAASTARSKESGEDPPSLPEVDSSRRLEERISRWPDHKQPFWFKNRKAIRMFRNWMPDATRFSPRRTNLFCRFPFRCRSLNEDNFD